MQKNILKINRFLYNSLPVIESSILSGLFFSINGIMPFIFGVCFLAIGFMGVLFRTRNLDEFTLKIARRYDENSPFKSPPLIKILPNAIAFYSVVFMMLFLNSGNFNMSIYVFAFCVSNFLLLDLIGRKSFKIAKNPKKNI